jgi:uncharacterized protein YlzI (FlbEa/FlbD family)
LVSEEILSKEEIQELNDRANSNDFVSLESVIEKIEAMPDVD